MIDTELLRVSDTRVIGDMYDDVEQMTGIGSWLLDMSSGHFVFSPNFYRILGLPETHHFHSLNDMADYLHEEDRVKLYGTVGLIYAEQRVPVCEYRLPGNGRTIKQKGSIYTDNNINRYIKGYIQEVATPRQPAEEAASGLAERLQFAESISDAGIDRTWVIDKDYRITAWNKRSELITGIPRAEVLGKTIYEVFPLMETCEDVCKGLAHAFKGYAVFIPSGKCHCEEGYYEDHFLPLKDEEGNVTGVLNIKHDVAHRVKAENELKSLNKSLARKNKELKARNAELRSFAHVTSHDLKEPLRKIYTFVELILTREYEHLSESGKMYFKRIQASVQRMGLLTDDILTFSQLDIEDAPLVELDLNHTLAHVKDNLNDIIRTKGATIEAEKLPIYKGHRTMIAQLFQTIIGNSLKFQVAGNQPHVKISTSYVMGQEVKHSDALADAQYLKISFTDNGIGFEKKYAERIFEMFKRLDSADKYPGSGVGLALAKKIAELHHGFITAESTPGSGSTFHCHLYTGT